MRSAPSLKIRLSSAPGASFVFPQLPQCRSAIIDVGFFIDVHDQDRIDDSLLVDEEQRPFGNSSSL